MSSAKFQVASHSDLVRQPFTVLGLPARLKLAARSANRAAMTTLLKHPQRVLLRSA